MPPSLMANFVYLASQSPRRSQLLTQIGVQHELLLAGAEEDAESLEAVRVGESPKRYVNRVTALKLEAARARLTRLSMPFAPILCADTTVALGMEIFGKPQDDADAHRMLARLSGSTHRVLTAVAVAYADHSVYACSESRVTFDTLSGAQIDAYVASGEPQGKAGAYAVQGLAAAFIARISGSYSGIMGLPLFETARLLQHKTSQVKPCNKTY